MACSAVTLSIATVSAVLATALIAIAFGTDNWTSITVYRNKINDSSLTSQMEKFDEFFTRTKGLFRVCFPKIDERPNGDPSLYLSPVETYCKNVEYFIPDDKMQLSDYSTDFQAAIHMGRSVIALIIVAFFFIFVAFWTGVIGCWRRSPGNVTSTAILMIFACLFTAGGMGLWHGVEYYETTKITEEHSYLSWPQVLKDNSHISYDWSYMISWIGVGFCLISSFLFFGAAHCLQEEKEKEHVMKMQCLLPMYPQKQQYPYNYGYGYPGPYYYGSQYGPYNY